MAATLASQNMGKAAAVGRATLKQELHIEEQPMIRWLGMMSVGLALTATSAGAEVYCNARGLPHGCVVRPGPGVGAPGVGVVPGAGAPGVGVAPGAGAGAPGVGVTPNAGVGVDRGGPVNRPGLR